MANVKQVLVWRHDLKVRKGKIAAQIAHASMKVFFDKMEIEDRSTPNIKTLHLTSEELEWVDGIFTKICLYVNSEAELDDLYNKAKAAGLNCSMIVDSGLTEFNGVPTKTCIAIGPNEASKIDEITGKLSLL